MAGSAVRTDPDLWNRIKADVTRGDKGGASGQWSARKAQLAVAEYKKQGGGYKGRKQRDNHLVQWTLQDWGTKSGRPSGETHERYLPRAARDQLTDAEYKRTTAKKRTDTALGKQFSGQPRDVADKVAPTREAAKTLGTSVSKADLLRQARGRNIQGRSRMSKSELARALHA